MMIKKMMIKKMMIKKKMTIKEWVKNMTIRIKLIIEQNREEIMLVRDNNSYIGIKKQNSTYFLRQRSLHHPMTLQSIQMCLAFLVQLV
mgnify:CR=1 FL=1